MESIRHGSMPLSDFYCKLMTDALGEQTPFPIDVKILSAKSTQTQSLLYQCSAIWVGSRYTVSSVTQLCLTLCDPMDCSTPGFPVHHQLPEPIQTHVHRIGDAIQPSHPLLSPSTPTFNLSQHQGLSQWVSSLHQVAKGLEFQLQHHSFQWTFRADFLAVQGTL